MSVKTEIQWCDSTCNPTMGCDGCELWSKSRKSCYAGMLHTRFGGVTPGYAPSFEQVTPFPGRMAEAAAWTDLRGTKRKSKPWLAGLPRLIFVSDMSDSLSASVSFEFLEKEIICNVVGELGSRHEWLWLTKRPERMAQFSRWLESRGRSWPKNLWAGTSITTQNTTTRIKSLVTVGDKQTIHFLSVEPQIEDVNLTAWLPRLDWIIQGGESGRTARPFDLAWARSLLRQCREHRVPYFLKQLGSSVWDRNTRLAFEDAHAGDWAEWPRSLRVRRFPTLRTKGEDMNKKTIKPNAWAFGQKDKARAKDLVLADLKAYSRQLLGQQPIMAVAELERKCHQRFKALLTEDHYKPLSGQTEATGRKYWENLVDWVKADLTRQGLSTYVNFEGVRHIVFLEPVGEVDGVTLCRFGKAHRLVASLAEMLNGKATQR